MRKETKFKGEKTPIQLSLQSKLRNLPLVIRHKCKNKVKYIQNNITPLEAMYLTTASLGQANTAKTHENILKSNLLKTVEEAFKEKMNRWFKETLENKYRRRKRIKYSRLKVDIEE